MDFSPFLLLKIETTSVALNNVDGGGGGDDDNKNWIIFAKGNEQCLEEQKGDGFTCKTRRGKQLPPSGMFVREETRI